MKKLICLLGLLALAACAGGQKPTAVKVGKPYSVAGETYTPAQNDGYDEEGIASWYGPGFHGGRTANGETFDSGDLTAAHRTLPMPSFVKVTNLKNGKEIVVRINDRGPFKKGRIIDLSSAAAKRIDVHGLQHVRVQYLKDKTERYWAENHLSTKDITFAKNSPVERPTEIQSVADEGSDEPSAPILSVSQSELAPASKSTKPSKAAKNTKPKFSLVSNAEAAEIERRDSIPVENSNLNQAVGGENIIITRDDENPLKPLVNAPPPKLKPEKSPPPMPNRGGYYVQAGAFSREENANGLASKLLPVGSATVSPIQTSKGTTLYRVWVGPEPSREAAQQVVEKLRTLGVNDARVVVQ